MDNSDLEPMVIAPCETDETKSSLLLSRGKEEALPLPANGTVHWSVDTDDTFVCKIEDVRTVETKEAEYDEDDYLFPPASNNLCDMIKGAPETTCMVDDDGEYHWPDGEQCKGNFIS